MRGILKIHLKNLFILLFNSGLFIKLVRIFPMIKAIVSMKIELSCSIIEIKRRNYLWCYPKGYNVVYTSVKTKFAIFV